MVELACRQRGLEAMSLDAATPVYQVLEGRAPCAISEPVGFTIALGVAPFEAALAEELARMAQGEMRSRVHCKCGFAG
eukprot:10810439-Alexandrium_andersonii.AAC.1